MANWILRNFEVNVTKLFSFITDAPNRNTSNMQVRMLVPDETFRACLIFLDKSYDTPFR
jgi:hypothetical protein